MEFSSLFFRQISVQDIIESPNSNRVHTLSHNLRVQEAESRHLLEERASIAEQRASRAEQRASHEADARRRAEQIASHEADARRRA